MEYIDHRKQRQKRREERREWSSERKVLKINQEHRIFENTTVRRINIFECFRVTQGIRTQHIDNREKRDRDYSRIQ